MERKARRNQTTHRRQRRNRRRVIELFWLTTALLIFLCFLRLSDNGSVLDADVFFVDWWNLNRIGVNDNTPQAASDDPSYLMDSLPAPTYHLVVSTGCSPYQDWQSYVMFFHAVKSGQVRVPNDNHHQDFELSYVTRVVSGCTDEEAIKMNKIHNREIAPMAPGRFFIHHTPSYRFIKPSVDYVYFNKAFGYLHWLTHSLRYPYRRDKFDNVTFILLDPDQIILRPFTNNFTNRKEIWGGPFQDKRGVERGQPFAQEYAMGIEFMLSLDMTRIAPMDELPSSVSTITREDAHAYMIGPPYVLKGYDFWRLVNKWVEFAPYVYDQRPAHISEMYAYSIAAAHLDMKHAVARSFMVSNADVLHGEGWQLIQDIDDDNICGNVPQESMPHVLHYCQFYGVGKYFFSKYHLPQDFISCESPLVLPPPNNISKLYNYWVEPATNKRTNYTNHILVKRAAFALCHLIQSVNEAAIYYKQNYCPTSKANYEMTLSFFADLTN